MQTTVLISGMNCAHCVRAVFTSLSGVEGINNADVSLGRVVIEHDTPLSGAAIREAISAAGYEVTEISENRRVLPQAMT